MQKLTLAESGRVTAVFKDAVENLALASRIPHSFKHANAAASAIESAGFPGIANEVTQLAAAEQAYRDMLRERKQHELAVAAAAAAAEEGSGTVVSPGASSSASGAGVGTFISGSSGNTSSSSQSDPSLGLQIRATLKALRREPRAIALLPPAPAPPSSSSSSTTSSSSSSSSSSESSSAPVVPPMTGFQNVMKLLVEVAAKRLITTRQQRLDSQVEAKNKSQRIENAEREVALLRDELAKQRASRASQMKELNASLAKVKDELLSSQRIAEAELKELQSTGAARTTQISTLHEKNDDTLHANVEKLHADIKQASDAHIDAEANLRKRKARARLELETLIHEYDAAMTASQAALEKVTYEYTAMIAPTEDLRQYYAKIDAELSRLEQEKSEADEKEWAEIKIMNHHKAMCARVIQKRYKIWKTKKTLIEKAMKKAKEKALQ